MEKRIRFAGVVICFVLFCSLVSSHADITDRSFIKEVYTGASDLSSRDLAVRVFEANQSIRFHMRYFTATAGDYTVIFMVTNAIGQLQATGTFSVSAAEAEDRSANWSQRLAAGNYLLTGLLLGPQGQIAISPEKFHFTAE